MDHDHHAQHGPAYAVANPPHQHAFTLVGERTLFGVHMTQYHHEMHKYQLVMLVDIGEKDRALFDRVRREYPSDFFVLCNDESDEMTIPELACGRRAGFVGNVFQGLPPFTPAEAANPHFFPWALRKVEPLLPRVEVRVVRIVTFRPFAHHLELPEFATYLLFGEGKEAHMTNLQTARLATGPFEVPAFGPDYDHVMSLAAAPDWLQPAMLEAGIVVTTPAVRLRDAKTGAPTIPCGPPFRRGATVDVLYRGIGPARQVVAGETFLCATAVCNSEQLPVCPPGQDMHVSSTPPGYLR